MRRRFLLILRALLASGALAVPIAAQQQASERDSTLTIVFFDVGQGDATWIVLGAGHRQVLIDAGGSTGAIQQHLRESSRDTIDLVVATHAHEDHIGGMPWVFDRYVVRAYMDNGVPHTTQTYLRTMLSAQSEPGLVYLEATERTVSVGNAVFRILPPARADASQNDNSVGVLLEFGKFRALFTGDSEGKQIARWIRDDRIPRVDVVKAAHHGAENGVTAELIERTRPATVVISAGARNSYGHPSPRVVQRWTRAGATVISTHTDGTVFLVAKMDGSHRIVPMTSTSRSIRE